jgi:hypothetical protein
LNVGLVLEANLATTQGNVGLKGHPSDHSIGGCSVISLLIASAGLLGLATTSVVENIIDVICQAPLRRIRALYYVDQGFAHVTADEAIEELIERGLLERPDVSSSYLSRDKIVVHFPFCCMGL